MNSQEAKFILQAYRPGGQDATDPQFAEALELAKKDPEMSRWLAGQTAFDAAVTRKLRELRAPEQSKASILAGQRVIEPACWWKQPVWRAMAAAFVLLLGLGAVWFNGQRSPRFAAYRERMLLAAAVTPDHLDLETADPKQIHAWFAGHQAEANFTLPVGLQGVPSMGCKVLDWHGRKVSMLCYVLEGSKHVDLFVIKRHDLRDPPPEGRPQFATTRELTTASWSRGDTAYLLVGKGDETFFRKYVATAGALRAQWRRVFFASASRIQGEAGFRREAATPKQGKILLE